MNTVFNPTTNGNLHLGHLYMILVNEYEAHSTGGKFIIRFDDDQFMWTAATESISDYVEDVIAQDMRWARIKVDRYTSQRITSVEIDKMLYYLNKGPLSVQEMKANTVSIPHMINPMLHDPYPYVPWITARKVVEDFMDKIDLKIRGDDLATEYGLYSYFCDLWGLPQPGQWFLPRLFNENGAQLADVSKTRGNWKLHDLRQKTLDSNEIVEELAKCCLKDPKGPWSYRNVKQYPTIPENFLL